MSSGDRRQRYHPAAAPLDGGDDGDGGFASTPVRTRTAAPLVRPTRSSSGGSSASHPPRGPTMQQPPPQAATPIVAAAGATFAVENATVRPSSSFGAYDRTSAAALADAHAKTASVATPRAQYRQQHHHHHQQGRDYNDPAASRGPKFRHSAMTTTATPATKGRHRRDSSSSSSSIKTARTAPSSSHSSGGGAASSKSSVGRSVSGGGVGSAHRTQQQQNRPHLLSSRSRSSTKTPPRSGSAGGGSKQRPRPPRPPTATVRRRKPNPKAASFAFQNPADDMTVSVRTVDLSSRIAFERVWPPDPDRLRALIEEQQQQQQQQQQQVYGRGDAASAVGGAGSVASGWGPGGEGQQQQRRKNRVKISPSPQHAEVLRKLYGRESARQLAWGASVSPDADPFTGWFESDSDEDENDDDDGGDGEEEEEEDGNCGTGIGAATPGGEQSVAAEASKRGHRRTKSATSSIRSASSGSRSSKLRWKRQRAKRRRERLNDARGDGRYVPIHPIRMVLSSLPNHVPPLTNRRRRLPMRSDVGFPRATEEEIRTKQEEIAREAELEEASPRLVLLLTGNDIGGGSAGGIGTGAAASRDELHPSCRDDAERWAGGVVDGLPWAGKELVTAQYANARCNAKKKGRKLDLKETKKRPKPNTASIFAPPMDASFSSTQGWRPRPFSDRPPGLVYLLAAPVDVRFNVGDIEPLVCTMALYCLPLRDGGHATDSKSVFRGKISEDFTFPAGDWQDLLHEEAAQTLAAHYLGNDGSSIHSDDERRVLGSGSGSGSGSFDHSDIDMEERQPWRRKKRKALFSYDPLALPGSGHSERRGCLHLVVQVHKVTQPDAVGPYLQGSGISDGMNERSASSTSSKKKKTFGSRIRRTFSAKGGSRRGGASSLTPSKDPSSEQLSAEARASAMFEAYGTQFLTPLCFGVLPVFPLNSIEEDCEHDDDSNGEVRWPNGNLQQMHFYAFPDRPESHEDFADRLTKVAEEQAKQQLEARSDRANVNNVPSSSYDEFAIASAATFPPSPSCSPSRRGWNGSSSITRSTVESTIQPNNSMKNIEGFHAVGGSALIFSSELGVDFTQAMLDTPLAFGQEESSAKGSKLPRLLVDVSGDCAIMMHPDDDSISSGAKRRSDLVRLPPSAKPSGYADSSEVREVLYLPPRPDRKFDSSIPVSSSSLLNVLYVYPRSLRLLPDNDMSAVGSKIDRDKNRFYSLRIRLVQQGLDIDDQTGCMDTILVPLDSIYNPAPGGRSLLKAMFTKLPQLIGSSEEGAKKVQLFDIAGAGVPMRDEVKIRLPEVLDGSYFLQFSLISIDLRRDVSEFDEPESWLRSEVRAETLIPLSRTGKESSTGVRVTTVILNGLHRVKIGKFQLNVETRLASSIHVSDESVAAVLRDFPCSNDEARADFELLNKKLAISRSGSELSQGVDVQIPLYTILSNASTQAVLDHFEPLVFMHMSNLVNLVAPEFNFDVLAGKALGSNTSALRLSKGVTFMMETMRGVFEILEKIKMMFGENDATSSKLRLKHFLKAFFDSFDESVLSPKPKEIRLELRSIDGDFSSIGEKRTDVSMSSQSLETGKGSESTFTQVRTESFGDMASKGLEDDMGDALINTGAQEGETSALDSSTINARLTRGLSRRAIEDAPFSRRAFGASKTERMQAEAELYADGSRFTELLDDDETVVTTDTWHRETSDIPHTVENVIEARGAGIAAGNQWGIAEDPSNFEDLTQTSAFDSVRSSIPETGSAFGTPTRASSTNGSVPTPFSVASERLKQTLTGDNGLAKRVNTVAQVMIGQCSAPSLTSVLKTGNNANSSKSIPARHSETLQSEDDDNFTVSMIGEEGKPGSSGSFYNMLSNPCASSSRGHEEQMMSPMVVCCVTEKDFQSKSVKVSLQTERGSPPFTSSVVRVHSSRQTPNRSKQHRDDCPITFIPGSDVEDEGSSSLDFDDLDPTLWKIPNAPRGSRLRGNQRHILSSQLEFSFPTMGEVEDLPSEIHRPFLYESVLILWVQACLDHAACFGEGEEGNDSGLSNRPDPFDWPCLIREHIDRMRPQSATAHFFVQHFDFFLPLCLKSLALRCSKGGAIPTTPLTLLDAKHMLIFDPLVKHMALALMGQALLGGNIEKEADAALLSALASSDVVLDFLVGLLAIIHPAQVSIMIQNYFYTLRACEATGSADAKAHNSAHKHHSQSFLWTETGLRRVRCARQLRLHAIERLACLPRFVALNYPVKYPNDSMRRARDVCSWTSQSVGHSADAQEGNSLTFSFPDDIERFPKTHWLVELLASEAFLICSLSCEAVVAEAMAQIKASKDASEQEYANKSSTRHGASLSRKDLLRFQSTAIHAVTCVYELLLRRHAMDARFQSDDTSRRIAAMYVSPVIHSSIDAVGWLARMESTHKVRSLWLLCFLFVLQEAPETLLREQLRLYCTPEKGFLIHRFIRLLRLCNTTFQCFMTGDQHIFSSEILFDLSPWLVQESFNVLCATSNLLVDECAHVISFYPNELKKMAQGVFDLLLHVVSTPQSSVTHLRALGGASHALENFGAAVFLDVVGDNLQHYARIVLTLMNSVSLSVRSMAVDFFVSLLGGVYGEGGNVDEIALVFLTVMPEVVAREIALYSVSGKISTMADVESSLWPLRRALADAEETNPVDDDRVDTHLSPFLGTMCRACQAVIDGVLIELRLRDQCIIVGSRVRSEFESDFLGEKGMVQQPMWVGHTFDADEESLYEAMNFFLPETAPMQRLRWLMTLKGLHESKGQFVEAAETLILCARTIADSIPHIKDVWRPSRFVLWHDTRRSLWLSSVGEDKGVPDRGNAQVMEFADSFLEPKDAFDGTQRFVSSGRLHQPTVAAMCRILTSVAKDAVSRYLCEDGLEALAYSRLEHLLKGVMGVIDERSLATMDRGGRSSRHRLAEENAALRRVSANLNVEMTRLAERLLLAEEEEEHGAQLSETRDLSEGKLKTFNHDSGGDNKPMRQYYVRVLLLGRKPDRFKESTTIPTFLEWESPSICRVPRAAVRRAFDTVVTSSLHGTLEERVCAAFAAPLLRALHKELPDDSVLLRRDAPTEEEMRSDGGEAKTFLVVTLVHMKMAGLVSSRGSEGREGKVSKSSESKRFFFRKDFRDSISEQKPPSYASPPPTLVELTIAQKFPCALSRQRTLITSEFFTRT